MTSRPVSLARFLLYGTFYRLPVHWRRRLVRLGSAKFIIGGVVLVHDAENEGRLLLLRQPPGRGWSLPAGLLKRGEQPHVGAARELREETGIGLEPDELVPALPNAVVHIEGRWVDVVFEARVPASTGLTVDGAEVLEAAWHRLDQLPRLTRATAHLLGRYGIGPDAPDWKPGGTPERKPGGTPERKPGGTPERKPGDTPERKPGGAAERKPGGAASRGADTGPAAGE